MKAVELHDLIHADDSTPEQAEAEIAKAPASETLTLLLGMIVKAVVAKHSGGLLMNPICPRCARMIGVLLRDLERRVGEPLLEEMTAVLEGRSMGTQSPGSNGRPN